LRPVGDKVFHKNAGFYLVILLNLAWQFTIYTALQQGENHEPFTQQARQNRLHFISRRTFGRLRTENGDLIDDGFKKSNDFLFNQ
jgi:hypothetical protein